jgi:hypothetical protein
MAKDVLYSDLLKGIQVSPCIRDALGIGVNSIFNSLGIRKKTCPAFRNSTIIRKWSPVTPNLNGILHTTKVNKE